MSHMASVTGANEDISEVKPKKNRCVRCLKNNLFMITIIAGVLIGFAIGFGLRELPYISEDLKIWISMPGDIYIRVLKLTILPLIMSNVIVVIARLDPKENGKISLVAFIYIVIANIIGAAVGAACTAIIAPGSLNSGGGQQENDPTKKSPTTSDVFADLFLNIFPDNIVGIAIYQVVTTYAYVGYNNTTGKHLFERVEANDDGTNMIGVIFVAVAFGLAASAAQEKGVSFLEFCASLSEVVLKLIRAFLKATPVGVCFMIAGAIVKVDDIVSTFAKLGLFIATVFVGIAVLFIITLIVYVAGTRRNPFVVIPHLMKAWFLGFATTSAIVTVPEIYQGCDELGIRKGLSRFVAPLAATLKADGSACFIVCGCIFVAQLEEKSSPGTIVVIWLLTSALALAIPHIPSSSIVIMLTILTSVGVPVEQVSLLYATEWLLDRVRTGMSTISTFYLIVFTHWVTLKSAGPEDQEGANDEYDEVMSELSKSFATKA
uniref:Amino acid transporter n=1 Tax=Schistocephalus solidus TaxID=70667 RepID=A0A0X3P7C7_SCHSO